MILQAIQLIVLGMLSIFLIFYFSHKSTPIYVRLLVFLSFYVTFISFMILPLDIYQNSKISTREQSPEDSQEHLQNIRTLWKVIFYVNFWGCWIVLPFFQEYQDSGQFTIKGRLKDAVKMNMFLIGVLCTGAACIVIYLTFIAQFSLSQLPAVFSTLVNMFGMLLVTLALGFGFVSLPKQFYSRRDYKRRVKICHRSAEIIKHDQEQIYQQVYHIRQLLENEEAQFQSPARVSSLLSLIGKNFNLDNYRAYDDPHKSLRKKSLPELHKLIKKHSLHFSSCESQLDELVDDLRAITVSFSNNNYKWKHLWYTFLFVLSVAISVLFYLSEISIFTTEKISLIYWLNYDFSAAYFFNCLIIIYIAYVMTHTIFRVKVYRVFQMHKGHSTAASMLFTSINMARICYPLCYNYLQLTSVQKTQFQAFLGQVQVPNYILHIFPILMLILAVFNLLDIYDKILGYLGLGSYAFDAEQEEEKSQEGKNILIDRFKERNYEGFQMQMIQLL